MLHLKIQAPCFKTLATQQLLRQSGIDFFNNSEWPGSSPDLNPAENLRAIINEDRMLNEKGRGRYSHQTLLSNLQTVLHDLEHDSELFAELPLSFRHRLDADAVVLLLLLAATRITNL